MRLIVKLLVASAAITGRAADTLDTFATRLDRNAPTREWMRDLNAELDYLEDRRRAKAAGGDELPF